MSLHHSCLRAKYPRHLRCIDRHFPAPISIPEHKANPSRICVVKKKSIKRTEMRNHCSTSSSKTTLCYHVTGITKTAWSIGCDRLVQKWQIHFSALIPVCVVCSKGGIKRKETRYHCPNCPSKPTLCCSDCYRDYHTRMQCIHWMGPISPVMAYSFLYPLIWILQLSFVTYCTIMTINTDTHHGKAGKHPLPPPPPPPLQKKKSHFQHLA